MKILSYNVRGLRGRSKCSDVQRLIQKYGVEFCYIQETKKEIIDEAIGRAVWWRGRIGWSFYESKGRSGGILSIWNSEIFSSCSSWHMQEAMIVVKIIKPPKECDC